MLPAYEICETENGYSAKINIHPELPDEYIEFCDMTVEFSGSGRSKEAARSEAARNAWKSIREEQVSRKSFEELVGEPNRERAINQLQELWQKGYIDKPEYIYTHKKNSVNGQDVWLCECVFGDFPPIGVEGTNKLEAKKAVAFATTLELSREFSKYSIKEI